MEGEKIIGIKSPHDGLMGRNIYQFFSTLKEIKRGQKIIKVNVPHEVSSDKKSIKFAVKDVGSHRKRGDLDKDKFVAVVKDFQPTMILLAFCWSTSRS